LLVLFPFPAAGHAYGFWESKSRVGTLCNVDFARGFRTYTSFLLREAIAFVEEFVLSSGVSCGFPEDQDKRLSRFGGRWFFCLRAPLFLKQVETGFIAPITSE
jgi:hypothetical protein